MVFASMISRSLLFVVLFIVSFCMMVRVSVILSMLMVVFIAVTLGVFVVVFFAVILGMLMVVSVTVTLGVFMVVCIAMFFGVFGVVCVTMSLSMLMMMNVAMTFRMLVLVSVFRNLNGRRLLHVDWRFFVVDNLFNILCLHCVGEVCALDKLLSLFHDNLVLSFDFFGISLLKVDSNFVVNKRKDHAVMDRD